MGCVLPGTLVGGCLIGRTSGFSPESEVRILTPELAPMVQGPGYLTVDQEIGVQVSLGALKPREKGGER